MSFGSAIHQYDVGTSFEVTVTDDAKPEVAIDLSTSTVLEFVFEKEDGTTVVRTPVYVTDGTDGKLRYVTVVGDLDQVGSWKLQVHYVLASGVDRRADVSTFRVKENLA